MAGRQEEASAKRSWATSRHVEPKSYVDNNGAEVTETGAFQVNGDESKTRSFQTKNTKAKTGEITEQTTETITGRDGREETTSLKQTDRDKKTTSSSVQTRFDKAGNMIGKKTSA